MGVVKGAAQNHWISPQEIMHGNVLTSWLREDAKNIEPKMTLAVFALGAKTAVQISEKKVVIQLGDFEAFDWGEETIAVCFEAAMIGDI